MRQFLLIGIGLLTAVCSGPGMTTPTPPGGGGGTPPPSGLYDLTLEVYEDAPEGQRPVPAARGHLDYQRPGENFGTGDGFVTDDNGRYVFPHVLHGTTLRIRADKSGFYQPCCVGATVTAESTLRLELVRRGTWPRVLTSPVLSGMVYTETPQGRQPVVDLAIGYLTACTGLVQVYGRTDDQGRYVFCRLPPGPGCVYMFWGEESEFEKRVPVNITGDRILDIDFGK